MSHHPTVRRPGFDGIADADPVWSRLPELACAANAVSLLMPHLEPYVVRVTRAVLPVLGDPLARQADAYTRQEAAHHHQHRRLNDVLAARYRGVRHLEGAMAACHRWLARRGTRFGVAFAAGFESVAFASARWVDRRLPELFEGAGPAGELFLWHLAEEVEHKSVAFDVASAVGVGRPLRAAATATALAVLAVFTVAGTALLLAGERRLLHPVAWARLARWSLSYAFEVLPLLAVSLTGRHHPADLADPPWLVLWLRERDGVSRSRPDPS